MQKVITERHRAFRPFTRDHHHILLFCYRLREGFRKGITTERIKSYSDWFYQTLLLPHFSLEEKYLFPILGDSHPFIVKSVAERRQLNELFFDCDTVERSLQRIERDLDRHVRFEEDHFFSELQKYARNRQLIVIDRLKHDSDTRETWADPFWLTT